MSADDRELLEAVARGDRGAFGTLYDRFAPRSFALLLLILRDRSDAEDALQEAFFDVWRTADRYDPALGGPASWIMLIVRSRGIDRLRSRRARRGRLGLDAEGAEAPARGATPTQEQFERVREGFGGLTEEQRSALWMAFCRGLTRQQIADHEAVPVGTIKSRIRTGLARLRQASAPELE